MRSKTPSRTAEMVAFQRATDQKVRADRRIVDDPFAVRFLGPPFRAALAALSSAERLGGLVERAPAGLTNYVKLRHRVMDDRLLAALRRKRGAVRQVVILGAGYDMRAHRMAAALVGRPVFEVDHPATSRRKGKILASLAAKGVIDRAAMAKQVTVDFQKESFAEKLIEGGFREGALTFFIWEGVSMYLRREAVETALSTMARLGGGGSEVVFDLWHLLDDLGLRGTLHRLSTSFLHALGEPILFGIHPQDAASFLARLDLELLEVADANRLRELYAGDQRPVYPACYVAHARVLGAARRWVERKDSSKSQGRMES